MGSSSSKGLDGATGAEFFDFCNDRKSGKETERLRNVVRVVKKGMGPRTPWMDVPAPSVQDDRWETGAGGGRLTGRSSTASLPSPQRAEARVKRGVVFSKDQGAGDVMAKLNNIEEPQVRPPLHRPSEVNCFRRSILPDLYQIGRVACAAHLLAQTGWTLVSSRGRENLSRLAPSLSLARNVHVSWTRQSMQSFFKKSLCHSP